MDIRKGVDIGDDRLTASIEQPVLITRCVFHTLLQLFTWRRRKSTTQFEFLAIGSAQNGHLRKVTSHLNRHTRARTDQPLLYHTKHRLALRSRRAIAKRSAQNDTRACAARLRAAAHRHGAHQI